MATSCPTVEPLAILDECNNPADLKRLEPERVPELCEEIRRFIVDAVSRTGGHLGSNLGAVELAVALHRVFESPKDIIIWDTGHQAYPHKILTGRQAEFTRLRQTGGLSGYPSRAESEHDWVENSHASTALSWAHGLSTALDLKDENDRRVIAVVGDGALTGGMAFEALNNLGHSGSSVIIVLNDNGRSYAPTVGRLGAAVAKLRANTAYLKQRRRLSSVLKRLPLGYELRRGLGSAAAAVREVWEPPAFFETLGVRYSGPFDGHDEAQLETELRNAASYDEGPIVVHVLTDKGRGYEPAESHEEHKLHDYQPPSKSALDFRSAFTKALIEAAEQHPELVAITAAMPGSTGLLEFERRFPGRCFDVGIAEQHAVTCAAGMAMGGLRPVVALYSTFLTRAIDQLNYDVALHRLPVIFCIDRAGITGPDGPSHHGVLDMALLLKVPGMTVFAPSALEELPVMFAEALTITDGPVALRWCRGAAPLAVDGKVGSGLLGRKISSGTDICLIAVGRMVGRAADAVAMLADQGVSASLWDARVVKPLDGAMVRDAASHPAVVTVEDGIREGGVGSRIVDELLGDGNAMRIATLGTPASFIPHGSPDDLFSALGLDAAGIAASAYKLVE